MKACVLANRNINASKWPLSIKFLPNICFRIILVFLGSDIIIYFIIAILFHLAQQPSPNSMHAQLVSAIIFHY